LEDEREVRMVMEWIEDQVRLELLVYVAVSGVD